MATLQTNPKWDKDMIYGLISVIVMLLTLYYLIWIVES